MAGRARPRVGAILLALLVVLAGLAATPGTAVADHTQITILEADAAVLADPLATLTRARSLGVDTLRLDMAWNEVAPGPRSWRRPRFDAQDPAAYAGAWAPFDAVIATAHQLGISVDLDLDTPAPRWATGRDQPRRPAGYPHAQWEPDATQFGLFAQAAGERYGGDWNPVSDRRDPGDPADLPRVSFWSIWNEPNYGPSLAPQGLPGHPGVPDSPRMYRQLVDAAWRGLAASGHRTPADTILIGELAPRSQLTEPARFNTFNGMTPMVFLENLYCLTPSFRPLRGQAARLVGCPTDSAGSRAFATANPGLFENSGISDHPYDEWFAPDRELDIPRLPGWSLENTQDTSLATIGVLERGLDRLTAAYGNHEHLAIWDTEYGYQTSPPHRRWRGDERPWPSPARAALYDNWAEYLHWRNPRIRSFDQYLLTDGVPATRANDYGSFATGLIAFDGTPKADYASFAMPIYLPRTRIGPGGELEIWGAVRPDGVPTLVGPQDPAARTVTLLFRPAGTRAFSPIATVAVNSAGYYDVRERFALSGTVRARWAVPAPALATIGSPSLDSRAVSVSVRSEGR